MRRNNEDIDGMLEDIEGYIISLHYNEVVEMLINEIDEKWNENDIREYFASFVGNLYNTH